jgi:hypothetical protein
VRADGSCGGDLGSAGSRERKCERNRVNGDLSLTVCVRQEGVAQSKSGLC